jgi:hypothetical protein
MLGRLKKATDRKARHLSFLRGKGRQRARRHAAKARAAHKALATGLYGPLPTLPKLPPLTDRRALPVAVASPGPSSTMAIGTAAIAPAVAPAHLSSVEAAVLDLVTLDPCLAFSGARDRLGRLVEWVLPHSDGSRVGAALSRLRQHHQDGQVATPAFEWAARDRNGQIARRAEPDAATAPAALAHLMARHNDGQAPTSEQLSDALALFLSR